jgi:hypothetical protein
MEFEMRKYDFKSLLEYNFLKMGSLQHAKPSFGELLMKEDWI